VSELRVDCTSNWFESGIIMVALLSICLDGEQCWGQFDREV